MINYSSHSKFSCTMLRNDQNTTGVTHSRCCASAEILWSRSRQNFKNRRRLHIRNLGLPCAVLWPNKLCDVRSKLWTCQETDLRRYGCLILSSKGKIYQKICKTTAVFLITY